MLFKKYLGMLMNNLKFESDDRKARTSRNSMRRCRSRSSNGGSASVTKYLEGEGIILFGSDACNPDLSILTPLLYTDIQDTYIQIGY